MDDQLTAGLRQVADLGREAGEAGDAAALDRVRVRLEREFDARASGRPPAWRRGLVPVLASAIAVAVAATALLLPGHRASVAPSSGAGPSALTSRLAVLRRPPQSQDRLPVLPRGGLRGRAIPGLTRLLATPPGVRIYLVVVAPDAMTAREWSPQYGDLVTIVSVAHGAAVQGPAFPAADLHDGTVAAVAGTFGPPRLPRAARGAIYNVGVIPDGVARVRWVIVSGAGLRTRRTVTPTVTNNVAYARTAAPPGLIASARWYDAAGRVVPVSDAVRRRERARQQDVMRRQDLRAYAHYHYHAAPAILASFAVFTEDGRQPSGVTITHPVLDTLPFGVVNSADPRQPPRLDPTQIRQVTTRTGLRFWVIPGARGLCVMALEPASLPGGVSLGGGGSCTGDLNLALRDGAGFSEGSSFGGSSSYQVFPRSRTTATVAGRRIRVQDGVLVVRNGRVQ